MSTWIFGYGSLIWKPNLPYIAARWALLKGWERRFWQGSPDHRGTPEFPGRVLTLRPNPTVSCWGMAYCLDPQHEQATLAQLDHREKAGYDMREVLVHTAQEDLTAWMYIGLPENPHFLGSASVQEMAQHIATATGPSGSNRDYVLNLAQALGERLNPKDDAELHALNAALTPTLS